MIQIKLFSYYDEFPEYWVTDQSKPYLNCYVGDWCAFEQNKLGDNNIAIMLEPRSIEHQGYEFVEKHPEKFKHIFTHDSKLLRLPNAHFWVWCRVWTWADVPKTKKISMISSHKNCCELHRARTKLAIQFENNPKVDCFGTYKDPVGKNGWVEAYDAHAEYKFAIAFENYIDNDWFTEKILNCFSTKTVPIYYGARDIGKYFNADGIIQVDDWKKIPEIVENLDIDAEYEKRKEAIEDNYKRVKEYDIRWFDRFFNTYGNLLEEMCNDNNK